MAQYQGNAYYMLIDGTNVSAYVIDASVSQKIDEVDITAGANTTTKARGAGLADYTFKATFYMDDTAHTTQMALFKGGIHSVEFGIQGSASGKPRHVQNFLFTEVPLETDVGKKMVAFSISAVGAAAPSVNMYNGGVYS